MANVRKNFIDDMVDLFGYDYVIGYCLCSEYDVRKKANKTDDPEKACRLERTAQMYAKKADQLARERVANGL